MMKLLAMSVVFILLLLETQLYFPWWSSVVIAFVAGAYFTSLPGALTVVRNALVIGFVCGVIWLGYALWLLWIHDLRMVERMTDMLGTGHPAVLLALTFILAAFPTALAALSGGVFRQSIAPETQSEPEVK